MFAVRVVNAKGVKEYDKAYEYDYYNALLDYLQIKRSKRSNKQLYVELIADKDKIARYDLKSGAIDREQIVNGALYKPMYSIEELSEMFGVSNERLEQLRRGAKKTYKKVEYEYPPILIENKHYDRFHRRYYYNDEAVKVLKIYFDK
ncbi:MAG: hypothetical protein KGZ71_05870 [Desulfobulbaceae bacterium]|nr:hypothetical protein [Desulfobulbaceae bacterium]